MPARRVSMRKIRDVLRLKWHSGLSHRQIAKTLKIGHSTVSEYVRRAEAASISWPIPEQLSDLQLEQRLFPPAAVAADQDRPQPDWTQIHQEMGRKGVTLQLLWQEYKMTHPDGYQYSRFCDHYRVWKRKLDLVMRQDHRFGEKLFVDYAGQTIPIVDSDTGEVRQAQIFVAVLGASNYTYAEASWSQDLQDWIGAHQRAFHFFGGVPEIVVPDNLKSGVSRAHRYEPDLNPTYQDLAMHYGTAVIPARARKPRDKAKVETGVLLVERWILAVLRHRTFFSLTEANEAIGELLERLNRRRFKKLPGSRHSLFEQFERPRLRPLSTQPYEFARWKKARVHIDYHIEVEGHYYSVPYSFARQQVDVRLAESTIEIFSKGQRIASHVRNMRKGRHTTIKAHMPASHRHYADWTPERITDWAAKTGPATAELVQKVIASRAHPQQGYRSCLGILRLGESHGKDRLEAASVRALAIGALTFKSLASILKNGLESRPLPQQSESTYTTINHGNIRGASYYTHTTEPTLFNQETDDKGEQGEVLSPNSSTLPNHYAKSSHTRQT